MEFESFQYLNKLRLIRDILLSMSEITSTSFEIIEDSYGSDVSRMFQNNAESVILNESFYQEKPTKIKTKKFLGLF